jgi:polysaccharide deacetylase 2 family uncharacterized protein YibQ
MPSSGGKGRKRKRRSTAKTAKLSTTTMWLVGAAVVLILAVWWLLRPGPPPAPAGGEGIEESLRSIAASHGVTGDALEVDTDIRKVEGVFVRTWKLRFANSASREEFIAETSLLNDLDGVTVAGPVTEVGRVVSLQIRHGIEVFDLELETARRERVTARPERVVTPTEVVPTPTPRPEPPPGSRGRLAILLDDAGQRMDLVPAAAALPREVGVAILPFLPYSAETATSMYDAGHEVWLHLPMEAVGESDPGPGALMVGMSDDELHDTVYMAINNIPHVVGVNNHMGSKATANMKMMTWVMQDLASMGLAFIDSRTTVDTVAEEAARLQGVKTGRRHVFLDNDRTSAAIREQLDEAIYRARMEGEIIAIGHLTEVTIAVLSDELPKIGTRGVDLARPTELLD